MEVEELIKKAWGAVEKAGIPEAAQGVALKEAISYLRDGVRHESGGGRKPSGKGRPKQTQKPRRTSGAVSHEAEDEPPDEGAFFAQLADESGVGEVVLRDLLQLKGRVVHVLPATRKLGSSKAEQTRKVISLVAGAYAHGLDQSPVDAVAVRDEAKRKRCFDTANFSAVLKSMRGFGYGSTRDEIVVSSKWLADFDEAVKAITGTDAEAEEEA